jgi:hypothetical protein
MKRERFPGSGARAGALALAAAAAAGCAGPAALTDWGAEHARGGIALSLAEIRRESGPRGTDLTFRLTASGVPRGARLALWHRSRGAKPVRVPGVYLADDGRLMSAQSGDEAELHATGLARGEAYDLGVSDADGMLRAFAKVIPFPLESRLGGRRVWAELASVRGEAWIMGGEGFKALEEVNAVLQRGEEVHLDVIPASPRGTFTRFLFPAAWFKSEAGSGVLKISAAGGTQELRLAWGASALKAE